MVHRRTILGGFQTLLYPAIFILIGVYIFISWNAAPITTSAVVPYGHLRVEPNQTARITVSALFWGLAGPCTIGALRVRVVGLSVNATVNAVSVNAGAGNFYCNVTWDSVARDTLVAATTASVTLAMQGGHAAFVGYAVALGPHYLHSLAAQSVAHERNYDSLLDNYANGTVLPDARNAVFKGDTPTIVSVDVMWAQINVTTIGSEPPYQSGAIMGSVLLTRGSQARNSAAFAAAANEVAMQFQFVRSPTFLQVLVQPTGTVGVVLGSILAFGFTINNALAAGGKILEWLFRLCKKPRPHALEFFMRPYEGAELRSMAGYREHMSESDIKWSFMRREEHSHGGQAGHDVVPRFAPSGSAAPADVEMH